MKTFLTSLGLAVLLSFCCSAAGPPPVLRNDFTTNGNTTIHSLASAPSIKLASTNSPTNAQLEANYLCRGTNDALVIGSAINTEYANGYREFVFSPGTYVLTNTAQYRPADVMVTNKSGIIIRGSGLGAKFLHVAQDSAQAPAWDFIHCTNCLIRDIEIDGNMANQANTLVDGLYLNLCENIQVENVWAHDCVDNGIGVYGSSHVRINRCTVGPTSGLGHGLDVDRFTQAGTNRCCLDVTISQCVITNVADGVKAENVSGLRWVDNTVYSAPGTMEAVVIGTNDSDDISTNQPSNADYVFSRNRIYIPLRTNAYALIISACRTNENPTFMVLDNILEGTIGIGDGSYCGFGNAIIRGNTLRGFMTNKYGLIANWPAFGELAVENNRIENFTNGIYLYVTNLTTPRIVNNVMSNIAQCGIQTKSSFCRITGNRIVSVGDGTATASSSAGVKLMVSHSNYVSDNSLVNFQEAIRLEGSQNNVIRDNRVSGINQLAPLIEAVSGSVNSGSNQWVYNLVQDTNLSWLTLQSSQGVGDFISHQDLTGLVLGKDKTAQVAFEVSGGSIISGNLTVSNNVAYPDTNALSSVYGTNFTLSVNNRSTVIGSSNVNIVAIMQTTAGLFQRMDVTITNGTGSTWGISFSAVTNAWHWAYSAAPPSVLTNGTQLDLTLKVRGTNILAKYEYYPWP